MYLMYYKPTWSQKLTCKGIRSLRSMVRSFQARSFPLIVRSFHNIVRTFPESLSYEQNKSITRTVNPCTPARCLIPSPDPRHKEAAIIILNISNTMRIFSNHTNRFVSQRVRLEKQLKKTLTKLSISVLERIKVATLGFRCSNKYSKSVVWSLCKSLQSHKGEFLF